MQQLQLVWPQEHLQVSIFYCSRLLCTTCLNVLDSPGISLLLCPCCPFHHMVCSRTFLVLSLYAHPKAWWSRSHACKIVVEDFPSVQEHHVFLNAFSSQCLCTTWLDPKALALLPGFCIAVPLLAACAKTWLPKASPPASN